MFEFMRVRLEVGKKAKLFYKIEPHDEVFIRDGLLTDALKELNQLRIEGWEIANKSEKPSAGITEYIWILKRVKNEQNNQK